MAEQELDSLLIKVDSEIGNLQGINSAISALNRLAGITQNAKGAIKQLGALGDALTHFDGIGQKLSGINDVEHGIHRMVTALQRMTTITGSATKAINQFGKLGQTLNSSFSGVGKNLEGLDTASTGVLNLVIALEKLQSATGNANGASRQLGNLGIQLQNFKDVNLKGVADNIAEPLERIMKAIGNLGNNNTVSIKIDQGGIAHVNQVMRNTRRTMTEFTDWWQNLANEKSNINLNNMFDITQPTEDLQRNLNRAIRMLSTYENRVRDSADKLHGMNANFNLADLVNRQDFRTAFRNNVISDVMVEQIRAGIDAVSAELETRGTQEIENAWQHTLQTIEEDTASFLSSDRFRNLLNMELPTEQIRANLRTVQNELSRAMNAMERAQQNMQRLRAQESDESKLRADVGFRGSYYTFRTNTRYVEEYRRAVEQLNAELQNRQFMPQSDMEGLRQLQPLMQQLERYRDIYNQLSSQGNLTDEQMRSLGVVEQGLEIITGRIESIRNQLDNIQPSEDGILERMRQIADATEQATRRAEEMNNAMRQDISNGFSSFGNMLSGSGNKVLGSLGNLSSMFGQSVSNGTAQLSGEALQGLQGIAGALGTVATAVAQVTAVVGVAVAVFKTWWSVMNKIKDALTDFTKSCIQFARNMLSKVVGAFNAVVGAVSKTVSAVKSGVQILASALRKLEDFGKGIISVFSKMGSAIQPALKGIKAVLSLVTPKIVKTLSSANGSLREIVKNTRLLNKALQIANKWFTMLTRMLMRKIVQAFISGLKQAFDDMVLYEMKAEDAMLRLNTNVSYVFSAVRRLMNQVLAVFEPLINALSMPVESFLTMLTGMAENLSKFMAILTGQPYYLRAKKFFNNYGEEVEETTKKVKNLTNGLDELNILNDQKSGSEDKPWDYYFEKVPVDGFFNFPSIDDIIDKIIDWLKGIDWEKIWGIIEDFIDKVMDIVNKVLSRLDLAEWLGKTLGNLINTLFVILERIADNFDPKLLADWISTFIINALEMIDWDRINRTVEKWASKIAEFWNNIFANDELWDSVAETITNFLNEVVHYFDTFAWTFDFKQMAQQLTDSITKILQGFDWEQVRSAVEGWVGGLVDAFNTAIANKQFWVALGQTLKDALNNIVIEAIVQASNFDFKGFAESLKTAIQNALDGIRWKDFEDAVKRITTGIAEAINSFFGDEKFLTEITTAIANFTNAIISGIDAFLKKLEAFDIANAVTTALVNGFNKIDWDTAFLIPAEAINALSSAIRGLLDALPEGKSIADWLVEHFSLTYDNIDWDLIEQNIVDICDKIVGFINGLIENEDFWNKISAITLKGFKFVVDITESLKKIKWSDLAERIKNYINSLIQSGQIEKFLINVGDIAVDLFFTIGVVITGVDWEELGRQIASGINNVINQLYANHDKIRQIIEDAFTKFSNMISSVLQTMLENNSFAKLGTVIGELLLGIISGINIFLDTNATNIVNAMNQFAEGLVAFIDQHEDEIVAKLSGIIWSINRIIQGFFGAKGKFTTKLAEIIEQLPLDVLLGTIFDIFLNKLTAKLKMIDAIWENLKKRASFTNFIVACSDGIYALGKKLLGEIWEHFKSKFNIVDLLQDSHILPKGGLAGALIDLLQGLLTGNDNGEKESKTFSFGDFFDIKFDFSDIIDKWNKAVDGVRDFFGGIGNTIGDTISNIFGGKKKEATVNVDGEVTVDETDTSTSNQNKQIKIETTNYGTIYADKIKTDLIETIDIIADTLHVKDIITDDDAQVKGARREMDDYWGDNRIGAQGGELTRDGAFDTIKARLLEITEKITAPLLEIAEKITTALIEVSEKITTPVLEVAEKITTPLIEAVQMIVELITASQMTVNQISAGQLSVAQITASNLNVSAINSSLLTVGSIVASTLRVGTIDGSISGIGNDINSGTGSRIGSSISDYINNLISGNTGYGIYDIKEPTFNYGGRFSDLTGLVPSAEDYFSDYLYDTGNGTYTTKTDVGIYGGMENPYSKVGDYFDNLLDSYNIDSNAIAGVYGSNLEGKLKEETPSVLGAKRNDVVQATVQKDRNVSDMTLPDNAKYIRDYLMSFIGNENGVYGLMGNLYAESGLRSNNLQDSGNDRLGMTDEEYTDYINNGGKFTDNIGYGLAQWTTSDRKNNLKEFLNGRSVDDLDAQLEYLKYELENNYSGVLDTLKNATSIHEASNAVLTGFEKPKDQSQRTDLFRWGYGEDIASLLDEGDDQYDTQNDEDEGGYVGEFDEANVLGEKREGGYSFLDLLPTIFNYRMAEVYDIVDTWFGRLKNLVDAFMSTLYDYFYNMFTLIPTGTSSFNLAELKVLITDLANAIIKAVNQGFDKNISAINKNGDKIVDAIKNLKIKATTTSFNFDKLDDLMGEHCKHLQDEMNEHCIHICDALDKLGKTLGMSFSNITCNCNCGGNCGTCPIGGKETGIYRPDTLYGENDIGADTGTLANDDTPTNSNTGSRGTGGTKATGHGGGGYSPTTGGGSNTNAGGKNINYTENGQQRHVFAWVNGQMVRLSDDLPAELKDQIARGMYPLTYADGTYLSSDARNDILGFVKGRGWLLETGSKTAGQGTKNIGGGTGTGGTKGIRGGTTVVPKDSGVVINKGDILEGAEVLGDVRDTSAEGNPEIYDPATGEVNRNFDQGNGSDNGWIDLLDDMGITDLRGDKGTELDGTSKGKKGTDSGTGNGTGSELRDHNGELLGDGFVSLFGTDDTYDSGSKSDVINPISPTSGSSKDDSEYPIGSVYRTRENIKKQIEENERNKEAKAEEKRKAEEEKKKRKEEIAKRTEEAKKRQQERIKKAQEEKEKKKQEQEKAKEERRKKREEEKKQKEAEKAEKQKEKDKQKAEEKKKSEELLKKAKDLLKTVYENGTEGQKRQAKIQYQNIMPDFNSYKTNLTRYNALKRIADEVKKNKKNKSNTSSANGSSNGSDTSKKKEGIGSIPINSIPDDIANLDNNSAKTGGQNQLNKGEVAQAVDDNTNAVNKQTEAQNQTNTKIDKVSDDVKNVADSTTKTAQAQQQATTAVEKGTQAQSETTEAVNQTTQTLNSAKEDISSALGKLETAIQSVKTDTAPLLNAINDCKNAIGDIECTCSNCNSDSNTNTSNSNNGGNSGGNSGSDNVHTHEASIPLTNKGNKGNNTEATDTTNTTNNTNSSSTTSTDKTKETEQKSKEWLEYAKEKLDNDASFGALDGDIVGKKNTGVKIRAINERYAQKVLDGSAELGTIYVDGTAYNKYLTSEDKMALFNHWYQRFTAKGYAMGGMPKSGDFFVANENGSSEFIGSFGNKTVVANNDQIVTAVANGVSMANDRVVNAINQQTTTVENAIERKDLTVAIGDRQIAEANRRGQTGLGNKFVD